MSTAADEPARYNGYASCGPSPRAMEQVRDALRYLNPEDQAMRFFVGAALKTSFGDSGAVTYRRWSNLDEQDADHEWTGLDPRAEIGIGQLLAVARDCGWEPQSTAISVEDFYAYLPAANFIFVPTRELWPKSSVDAKVRPVQAGDRTLKPSQWLIDKRAVQQMTWAPGEAMIIDKRLISHGGWIVRPGCATFNLYKPPTIKGGDASQAGLWVEHIKRIYPADADHIISWVAHRVQRPQEKINHAIVLGGAQGIGKDTLLEPVKHAVGPWNFNEVTPAHLMGRFNGYVKSVILRISEARDSEDRYAFYEHTKVYTAAPPDVLLVDEKNIREYTVFNVCGVIITTNYKSNGLYLPVDDRRHFVAWSECVSEDFSEAYWRDLYSWYESGGYQHVAAYLAAFDLSTFNPKAPPPKTAAFLDIVAANSAPEDAEIADVLDSLGNPQVVTLEQIHNRASGSLPEWLRDRRNARQIPHRMEAAGYVAVRNPSDKTDGRWKVNGKRQNIYARKELSERERHIAAAALVEQG
jgi:hypothetical protein